MYLFMCKLRLFVLIICTTLHFSSEACTIVAVSGRVTPDGRPLLLKNRDSIARDIRINIEISLSGLTSFNNMHIETATAAYGIIRI